MLQALGALHKSLKNSPFVASWRGKCWLLFNLPCEMAAAGHVQAMCGHEIIGPRARHFGLLPALDVTWVFETTAWQQLSKNSRSIVKRAQELALCFEAF